jgi:hypothetical protein
MLSFFPRWRTVAGVLAAAAMSLTFVVPVSAAATINRFTETTTSYNDFTDDCTGASGLLIEVAVVDGQSVATSTGYHFEGTVTLTSFVAFNNGTYESGAGTEKLSFTSAPGVDVFTQVHMDSRALYSADGDVLRSATLRFVEHFTVTSDGTVRVLFEKVHDTFSC